MNVLDPAGQLEARVRPSGPPIMHQEWRDLLFIHWAVEPETVQSLLPPGLSVDVFPNESGELMAWIGLVPFTMHNIRPRWGPAVPWLSAFPETNLRTYVHINGKKPGVWFFSLDAARLLACLYARFIYALPYHHARMRMERNGWKRSYRTKRIGGGPELGVEYEVNTPREVPGPGSLEFFLVERYRLYSVRDAKLFTGLVAHPPYHLCDVTITKFEHTYSLGDGPLLPRVDHVVYSPGVKVDVWPIEPS